jgi:hypothetical protein
MAQNYNSFSLKEAKENILIRKSVLNYYLQKEG